MIERKAIQGAPSVFPVYLYRELEGGKVKYTVYKLQKGDVLDAGYFVSVDAGWVLKVVTADGMDAWNDFYIDNEDVLTMVERIKQLPE